ncbi:unnamed protein product [Staurois parvus]|uniref:Uncharacterized protein n=1 Tax=Staurois parvus TaxID=386267 RepID=A0ABN9F356_9NEOB|nr:unnamed protein product [Staurois parvus]
MFYYVIIIFKKMTFFKNFKFAAGSGAHTSQRHRDWNTEAGIGRRRMAGDAAGDTSRERRTR